MGKDPHRREYQRLHKQLSRAKAAGNQRKVEGLQAQLTALRDNRSRSGSADADLTVDPDSAFTTGGPGGPTSLTESVPIERLRLEFLDFVQVR